MTPAAHETLKQQMRQLALESMVGWLANQLRAYGLTLAAGQRTDWQQQIQRALSGQQNRLAPVVLRAKDPAEAMLGTALFHEAFEDLSKGVVSAMQASTDVEVAKLFHAPR